MADKTLSLFSRPPIPHNTDPDVPPEPAEEERVNAPSEVDALLDEDDPRFQQMVGNTIALFFTVDNWMDSKKAPHTFRLTSKSGRFWMTKSKKEYARLVAAGEVVFSPLEIEKFIHHPDGTLADFIEVMRADIYAVKKMDPAAKVVADMVVKPTVEEVKDGA